jgi:hypothetical protein
MGSIGTRRYGVRSPKFICAPCAQLYSLAETQHPTPTPPAFGLIYEGAIGQPRWTTSLSDPLHQTLGRGFDIYKRNTLRYGYWIECCSYHSHIQSYNFHPCTIDIGNNAGIEDPYHEYLEG